MSTNRWTSTWPNHVLLSSTRLISLHLRRPHFRVKQVSKISKFMCSYIFSESWHLNRSELCICIFFQTVWPFACCVFHVLQLSAPQSPHIFPVVGHRLVSSTFGCASRHTTTLVKWTQRRSAQKLSQQESARHGSKPTSSPDGKRSDLNIFEHFSANTNPSRSVPCVWQWAHLISPTSLSNTQKFTPVICASTPPSNKNTKGSHSHVVVCFVVRFFSPHCSAAHFSTPPTPANRREGASEKRCRVGANYKRRSGANYRLYKRHKFCCGATQFSRLRPGLYQLRF